MSTAPFTDRRRRDESVPKAVSDFNIFIVDPIRSIPLGKPERLSVATRRHSKISVKTFFPTALYSGTINYVYEGSRTAA